MKVISFAASSTPPPPDLVEKVRRIIDEIARLCGNKVALAFGGYWGLMKFAVDRAIEKGLTVLIMPPLERENHVFPEQAIVIKTGTSYRVRSVFLVRTGDALVALGGASGTMQEVLTAYCEAKPIYVLKSGLESDKLEAFSPYVDSRELSKLEFFDDPEELARRVAERLGCLGD